MPCGTRSSVSGVARGKHQGRPHHHVALPELVALRHPLPAAAAAGVQEVAGGRGGQHMDSTVARNTMNDKSY